MKKRTMKKWMAAGLAAVMTAGMLTGCGGGTSSGTAGGETGSAAASDDELITVTFMRSQSAVMPMEEQNKVVEIVKDKFNIQLELQLIPDADYTTKRSVALASDDLPDIISGVSLAELRQYAPTGMFLNINDYQEQAKDYLDIVQADDRAEATKNYEVDGGLYGFQMLEYNRIDLASLPALRMDRLAETGLDEPTTWDELYDVMLAIKELYPDNYVFSTRNGTTYMIGQLAYAMGSGGFPCFSTSGIYFEPKTESWTYGPTQDSFKYVIQFLSNAYKDGLLDPDYASMDKDTEHEKLSNGSLSLVFDNNSFVGRVYNPALAQTDENAYFDILKPMKSNNDTQRALRYEKDWTEFACVSADTKYPERVMELLNWMYTEEGRMVTNFGEEGTDYSVDDNGDVITSEALIEKHANDSDIASAVRSELGTGLLGLGRYIDESLDAQISDKAFVEEGEEIRTWTQDGLVDYNKAVPSFTTEEQEQVTELEQSIANVFTTEIDGFINGQRSMDEWDSFVETLKSQGTEQLEKLYNEAYQRAQQ